MGRDSAAQRKWCISVISVTREAEVRLAGMENGAMMGTVTVRELLGPSFVECCYIRCIKTLNWNDFLLFFKMKYSYGNIIINIFNKFYFFLLIFKFILKWQYEQSWQCWYKYAFFVFEKEYLFFVLLLKKQINRVRSIMYKNYGWLWFEKPGLLCELLRKLTLTFIVLCSGSMW